MLLICNNINTCMQLLDCYHCTEELQSSSWMCSFFQLQTCSSDLQVSDDDVEDNDRWVEEQIKKGTSGNADPAAVAAVRSAAAAAATAAAAPSLAYSRQLDGLGAASSSAGSWQQQQPEQLSRAGQDVLLTLQQGVAQLQVGPLPAGFRWFSACLPCKIQPAVSASASAVGVVQVLQ